jgi:hypothetical protein
MDPNPGELFGLAAQIDLPVEEIRHCVIVKADRSPVGLLANGDKFDDSQRVARIGDPEPADFGVAVQAEP